MYYEREISENLIRLFNQYPVLTLTGPRQSGKTTLCKNLFPYLDYVSFEDIENRQLATDDPREFLSRYSNGAILDEVQRSPDIISYIQTFVDEKKKNGLFILTGSRQFELMDAINQSLAGRTAIARLLPLSYSEIYKKGESPALEDALFKGFYPRLFKESLNPTEMYSFYANTYLERDVRKIINVQDLKTFETFLTLCAGRNAQVINYASLGSDCGIDQKTVKKWLSILEASYVIKTIKPYYKNLNKRIIKSPKMYFYDSGLVCYLLGINNSRQLVNHPLVGAIFESYVFSEIWKIYENSILKDNTYYFRDNRGREVDGIFDKVVSIALLEVKKSKTINDSFFKVFNYIKGLSMPVYNSCLIYGGDETLKSNDSWIVSWRDIKKVLLLNENQDSYN